MIGTQIRVGFDGSQVQKGLGSISKMFGKMGSTIGRGAFERVGQRATDLLSRIVDYFPDMIKDAGEFAGEMNDLAAATGETIPNLMKLGEMLRIGGAESVDTTRMLANFAKSLFEAKTEGGAAAEAFAALGLHLSDMEGKTLSEQFETLAKRVADSGMEFGELSKYMGDIFGGKMGYKIVAMMRDFDANAKRAGASTKEFASKFQASKIDEMSDAMGRFRMLSIQTASAIYDAFIKLFGSDSVDRLFDFLNPEKIRPQIESFVTAIKTAFDSIADGSWKDKIWNFGKASFEGLGKLIADSMSALWDKVLKVAAEAGSVMATEFRNGLFGGGGMGAAAKGTGDFFKAIGSLFDPETYKKNTTGKKIFESGSFMGNIMDSMGIQKGLPSPTSDAKPATAKQLDDLIKIEKDIYKQGNVAAWG